MIALDGVSPGGMAGIFLVIIAWSAFCYTIGYVDRGRRR